MSKVLSWNWWNERVVEVIEPYGMDWIAPRWYLVIVACAYLFMVSMCIYGIVEIYNV